MIFTVFVVLVAIRHCAAFHLSGGFKAKLGNRILSSALLGERENGNGKLVWLLQSCSYMHFSLCSYS